MPNKVWAYPLKDYADRAKIVKKIFNLDIGGFVVSDAIYFTKMLLENGKVYISENAYKDIKNLGRKKLSKIKSDKLNKIADTFKDAGVYSQTKDYIQDWINRGEFTWEHVVPVSIIGNKMKDCPDFIEKYFIGPNPIIDKVGHVCIVTKDEDCSLNHNYKNKMPEKINIDNLEKWTEKDIWARYISCNVNIHNLNIK